MTSVLRQLQAEWNTLVPAAQLRGIRRVRPLNAPLETIAYRRAKLEWLKAQLGSSADFDNLTFGVELEFLLPPHVSAERIAQEIREAGVTCHAELYNHVTVAGQWKIVTDGSIGPGGREVVSPPLRGEVGLSELRKVCTVLTRLGCKVSKRCGFHVHVGAGSQGLQFFKNLVVLYQSAEASIDGFMSPSRRGYANHYCQPVQVNREALRQASTVEQVANAAGQRIEQRGRNSSRYRKLSLTSYWQHGTVEFRHHQGTVDARKSEHWVRLVLRMCLLAAREEKVVASADELFDAVQAADSEREYFKERAAYFANRRA